MSPRMLDLFCGAGMAADGYAAAGWDVVGVDINPQPDFPYTFIRADALNYLNDLFMDFDRLPFDAIHASPPCQLFTRAKHLRDAQGGQSSSIDLLTPTLDLLKHVDIPWVMENVPGAKGLMPGAIQVCGSSFGLEVQRHRLFLSNRFLLGTTCHHDRFPLDPISGKPRPWGVYHVPNDSVPSGGRTAKDAEHARQLFGMDRSLPWNSIKEGFPPAYTEWVGKQLLAHIEEKVAA